MCLRAPGDAVSRSRARSPRRSAEHGADAMSDDARAERLKAALRENLKRRKAQSRGRARAEDADRGTSTEAGGMPEVGDAAGKTTRS